MKRLLFALLAFTFFCVSYQGSAQNQNLNTSAKTLTYEELYDTPYDINKLFVQVQPMYGELFSLNPNIGFGLKAQYYLKNQADFEATVRVPYVRNLDLTRNAAFRNSTVDNEAKAFSYYELLGTYHIRDEELDTETKFILFSKRYKGDKWAATIPLYTVIPTKVRRIFGARFGGMAYKSAVDYNRVMEQQGVTLISDEGGEISPDESVYGNMSAAGFYVGGSMTTIKNVAVQPDKIYGTLVNDLIFTTFFDINFAPMITVDDIYIDGVRFDAEPILKNVLGFRTGLEGKFNRKISWAYGGEIGYRPGLKKSGFFMLVKISFPVFATQLRNQVESFGK